MLVQPTIMQVAESPSYRRKFHVASYLLRKGSILWGLTLGAFIFWRQNFSHGIAKPAPYLQRHDFDRRSASSDVSRVYWCDGNISGNSEQCKIASNAIEVGRDTEIFQLLLKRAMDARRLLSEVDHDTLALKFAGHKFRNKPFRNGAPGAYSQYSLYAHTLTTPGIVNTESNVWLEFGVFTGASCNLSSVSLAGTGIRVYGFDTFNGLPEAWLGHHPQGHFDQGGKLPPVARNVRLLKGLFKDTLQSFFSKNKFASVAGMNVDCDLYQGAIESLNLTYSHWRPGTVIHFHELQQSSTSREKKFAKQEEVKALHEFLVTHPGTTLEMMPIRNEIAEPVVFIVR